MSQKLKCIRMSPEALEAISHPDTWAGFYDVPANPASNRKIAAVFHTPTGKYWAVGPLFPNWRHYQVTGVEKRVDGRWCWVIQTP